MITTLPELGRVRIRVRAEPKSGQKRYSAKIPQLEGWPAGGFTAKMSTVPCMLCGPLGDSISTSANNLGSVSQVNIWPTFMVRGEIANMNTTVTANTVSNRYQLLGESKKQYLCKSLVEHATVHLYNAIAGK